MRLLEAEMPKFKEGDLVKVTQTCGTFYKEGAYGQIVREDGLDYLVDFFGVGNAFSMFEISNHPASLGNTE